ncbi:hypothetical protein GCM10010172_11820 [Paractinoplanes ferrugineus]|uniref:CBM2 domain-containing protein n=1 Tax=Paractinoplanes ferrugineus TaxID=113564 RepID=A0A919IVE3_9ACTN|nr:cellulose binding domain-containing protein [Actinoplanes ferrugineus]GIE09746.1 hypothetical protein Afe05nite_15860 [Actinoplanes ferrugineus]
MPPKHSARPLGPAQLVLSAAAAVLVMLVVWVAVRAVGPAEASRQPAVALPVPSAVPAPSSAAPSWTPSTAPTPRRTSASPARSVSPRPTENSARPTETKTTRPATRKAPPPPAGADLAATLNVPASWEQGYVAAVRVRNNGRTAQSFTVTVSNNGMTGARLTGTWNAGGTQSGTTMKFVGGPLQPGATVTFGFQVSKNGGGSARPSGCSVVGGTCGMS